MSGEAGRGPTAPKYMRAEIRSCDRHFVRNEDGTRIPYLSLHGFNGRNEAVRVIMRGEPGSGHEDGELGEVLRQFPAQAGEGMDARRVARVLGTVRQGRASEFYDAVEVVRLNGPGADFVLAKRDGVMAMETAARLHAAGDDLAAYRLLEDTMARMCSVPAPSVARDAELSGKHPGPDPEPALDEVVPPGEDAEDRARRIYRSTDLGRGRSADRATVVSAAEAAGPAADILAASPAADGVDAPAPADGSGADDADARPTEAAPVEAVATDDVPVEAVATDDVPAPEDAAPEAPDAPDVPQGEVLPVSMPVHDETPASPEGDASDGPPSGARADVARPRVADDEATESVVVDPPSGEAPVAESSVADGVSEAAGPAEVTAERATAVEENPQAPAAEMDGAAGTPDGADAVPEAPVVVPETAAKALPAMPGFRSRGRMGVPSAAPAAAPSVATGSAAAPRGATSPAARPAAAPHAATGPAQPTAAASPRAPARPSGRPRMGMGGGGLPPAAQPAPEPDDEPVPRGPGM